MPTKELLTPKKGTSIPQKAFFPSVAAGSWLFFLFSASFRSARIVFEETGGSNLPDRMVRMKNPVNKDKGSKSAYKWQLSDAGISEEEIGKSILGALADDISVSVTSERVELIISKTNI